MNIYHLYTKMHNPHYLNRYIKFINNCIERNGSLCMKTKYNPGGVHMDAHHILPKADGMFPEYEDLSKHTWNKCYLTNRQHFIAHWMLSRAYKTKQANYAFWRMCHLNENRINS